MGLEDVCLFLLGRLGLFSGANLMFVSGRVFFWDVLEEKAIQPYGFLIYLKILKVGWLVACWLVDSVFLWSEVNVYKIGNYVFYVRKSVRYIVYI